MKIIQLHGGYTKEELMEFKYIVYGNCITQMKCILEAATKLRMSVSNPSNQVRFNRMLDMPNGGDSWSTEVAMDIKHLWLDQGVRDVYALKDKHYQLNDSANYFFESVDRIMQDNYMPIVDDVLRARVRTTGIQEAEFKFDDLSLRMLDVGGQRSERRKWIHCFDSVTAVLFCVSLSEYDQFLREDNNQNRMKESLILFDEVCNSVWFKSTAFILFLNKVDLFKEKIQRVNLQTCFPDFKGQQTFDTAGEFIKQKFVERNKQEHPIYAHFTIAISTENIEFVFKCIRDTVLKQILTDIMPY